MNSEIIFFNTNLITDRTDTEVEENFQSKSYFMPVNNHLQQNGFENCDENDFVTNDFRGLDFSTKKKTKPLKLKKKFYEFYAAPMSKYICHFVSNFPTPTATVTPYGRSLAPRF